jgi:GAF domain-containing protein
VPASPQPLLSERWLESIVLGRSDKLRLWSRFARFVFAGLVAIVAVVFQQWIPTDALLWWVGIYFAYLVGLELLRWRLPEHRLRWLYDQWWFKLLRQQADFLAIAALYYVMFPELDIWPLLGVPIFVALMYFDFTQYALGTALEAVVVILIVRLVTGQALLAAVTSAALQGVCLLAITWVFFRLLELSKERAASRELAEAMTGAQTPEGMCQALADVAAKKIPNANAAVVHLVGPQPDRLLIWSGAVGVNPANLGRTPMRVGEGIAGRALSEKKTINVRDTTKDDRFVGLSDHGIPIGSLLSAPMVVGEKLIGVVSVHSHLPKAFDSKDSRALTQYAIQVASALRNAEMYHRRTGVRSRLHAILESAIGFGWDQPIELLYEQCTQSIAVASQFAMSTLELLDDRKQEIRVVATYGVPENETTRLKAKPFPWDLFASYLKEEYRYRSTNTYFIRHDERQKLPRINEHSYTDGSYTSDPGGWHAEDILRVPLRTPDGDLLGYVSLDGPSDHRLPTLEIVQALELHARLCASSIRNAQLMARVAQNQHRMRLLYQIGLVAQRCPSLDKLLHVIAYCITARDGFGYDYAVLLRVNGSELIGATAAGELACCEEPGQVAAAVENIDAYLTRVAEGGEVAWPPIHQRTRDLRIPLNADEDDMFSKALRVQESLVRLPGKDTIPATYLEAMNPASAVVVVPLVARGTVYGILVCGDAKNSGEFTNSQISLLETLASQAAIAIQNSELQRENQKILQARVANEERRRLRSGLHQALGLLATGAKWETELAADQIQQENLLALSVSLGRLQQALRLSYADLKSVVADLDDNRDHRNLIEDIKKRATAICRDPIEVTGAISANVDPQIVEIMYRVAAEGITNAIKYSGFGQDPKVHLKIEVAETPGCAEIRVRDTGAGFKEQDLKDKPGGLRQLRELIGGIEGGNFEAHSAPGKGTELRAWFELRRPNGRQDPGADC